MPTRDVHFRLVGHFNCQERPSTPTVTLSAAKNLQFTRKINAPVRIRLRRLRNDRFIL